MCLCENAESDLTFVGGCFVSFATLQSDKMVNLLTWSLKRIRIKIKFKHPKIVYTLKLIILVQSVLYNCPCSMGRNHAKNRTISLK